MPMEVYMSMPSSFGGFIVLNECEIPILQAFLTEKGKKQQLSLMSLSFGIPYLNHFLLFHPVKRYMLMYRKLLNIYKLLVCVWIKDLVEEKKSKEKS